MVKLVVNLDAPRRQENVGVEEVPYQACGGQGGNGGGSGAETNEG